MRFYESNIGEIHKEGFRYPTFLDARKGEIFLSSIGRTSLPGMQLLGVTYTDRDLAPFMTRKCVCDPTRPGHPKIFFSAFNYKDLEQTGIRVNRFDELKSDYRVEIDDLDFFVPDNTNYVSYAVYRGDKLLVNSVVTVAAESYPELSAEKKVEENLQKILSLPHADALPDSLKRIVYAQFETYSGMLFLENDEEFRENWTEEDLKVLGEQIDKFGLEKYIEMSKDPKDVFAVEEGESAITVYCGLPEKFNFI